MKLEKPDEAGDKFKFNFLVRGRFSQSKVLFTRHKPKWRQRII